MKYNLMEGVKRALLSDPEIVKLVSAKGIWSGFAPLEMPAGTSIVMRRISGGEEGAMSGNENLSHPRLQFTIGGLDPAAVHAVRDRILDQWSFRSWNYVYDTAKNLSAEIVFCYADDHENFTPETRVYEDFIDIYIWANT